MSSTTEIFTAMQEAISGESGQSLQRKFPGTVIFIISDTNDKYYLDLGNTKTPSITKLSNNNNNNKENESDNDNVTTTTTTSNEADLYVTVSLPILQKLVKGELNPQHAFLKKQFQIRGKKLMSLGMKLTLVLHATRKCLPQSKL